MHERPKDIYKRILRLDNRYDLIQALRDYRKGISYCNKCEDK